MSTLEAAVAETSRYLEVFEGLDDGVDVYQVSDRYRAPLTLGTLRALHSLALDLVTLSRTFPPEEVQRLLSQLQVFLTTSNVRPSRYGLTMRVPPQAEPANYINHIFIVGDMSPSMGQHKDAFVKVFDNLVAHLARRSRELDQETRISAYLFAEAGSEQCVIWDKDVLRMPSIARYYAPQYYGMTALIDATMMAIGDIGTEVSQKYGDHAVMTYVITDGIENHSRRFRAADLRQAVTGAAVNQTFACFVPDQRGVFEAKGHGFPAENISVWDTTSEQGVEQMGEVLRDASDVFMEGRRQGIRGYNAKSGHAGGLFRIKEFTAAEVSSTLRPLAPDTYVALSVPRDTPIREFVEGAGLTYVKGKAFYQLTKSVKVQSYKGVIVEQQGLFYTGDAARKVLGLPDYEVTVQPAHKPGCTIYFQSTSVNRKLFGGTRVIVMR